MMSVLSVWKKHQVEVLFSLSLSFFFSRPHPALPSGTSTNALPDLCLMISVTMVKPAVLWISAQSTRETER